MNLNQITGDSLGLMVKLYYPLDLKPHHHSGLSGRKKEKRKRRWEETSTNEITNMYLALFQNSYIPILNTSVKGP